MVVEIDLEKLSEKTKIALAGEKELDKTIQQMLARDKSKNVKIALIQNPSVLEEVCTELINEDAELLRTLGKDSRIIKKIEILLESWKIKGEDAIYIAKIHNKWLSSRLFRKMRALKTQPWFKDVVEIWIDSGIYEEEQYAAKYIYVLSIEKQQLIINKCNDYELIAIMAEYIDSKEVLDILVNDKNLITRGAIQNALINNRNYDISKLAKKYIIEHGKEYILEKLAIQEKDNEILLKLLDVKNMQIRKEIGRILINSREDIFSYEVYKKIADMMDPLTRDKALLLKANRYYKTIDPS